MVSPTRSTERPHRQRLPRSRALTCDVLHYHAKVPTCAHDRICDLSPLAAVRRELPERISWTLLFIKAFGLVARDYPVLRQVYQPWPWPHIFQHSQSVGMMAIQREHLGEPWLFWGRFSSPETQSLLEMQNQLTRYLTEPVTKIFKRQWQLSAFPTPLRRLFWWWTLNASGAKRPRRAGTFFLTTLAGRGAEIQHPPAFLTSNMTYGPFDEQGRSRVTIA
ncbi:MAG: hypothetical protein KDA84_28450, partial [Planctomycetaceae bacterium]|nr:hypothetical protein [Planctomycetaceae bacterium]